MNKELIQKWKDKLLSDPPESWLTSGQYFYPDAPITATSCACAIGKLVQLVKIDPLLNRTISDGDRQHDEVINALKEAFPDSETLCKRIHPIARNNDAGYTPTELCKLIDKVFEL